MNTSTLSLLSLLFSLSLAGASAAQAEGSGSAGTRGGGDIVRARKLLLSETFIDLKGETKAFLKAIDVTTIKDRPVRALIIDLLARGVIADIEQSPYSLSEHCVDSAQETHGAATAIGVKKSPVCFDLERLSAENTERGEFVGLALHEQAHHFGYPDGAVMDRLIEVVAERYAAHATEGAMIAASTDRFDSNRRAHKTVWLTLYSLDQHRAHFKDGGRIEVSSLPATQGQPRDIFDLASVLDRTFVNGRGARHTRPGLNYTQTVGALIETGAREGRNLRWFADELDALYDFWQE